MGGHVQRVIRFHLSDPPAAGGFSLFRSLTYSLISFFLSSDPRCGVLALDSADDRLYASKGYINDVALGARTIKFSSTTTTDDSDAMMRTVFPDSVKTGSTFDGAFGYVNFESGWAVATRGIEMLMSRVIASGGKVLGGKAVTGLIRPPDGGGRTSGVTLADGSSISARLVVIASGSWTASTFRRDLLLLDTDDKLPEQQFLSTG